MTEQQRLLAWTPDGFVSPENLLRELAERRRAGQRIITTNGCFDWLHPGHVRFMAQARALGDLLIVGLNSDASARQLKGAGRPLMPATMRAEILAGLTSVSHVICFDDFLPIEFLTRVKPRIHCKAGDYDGDTLPETACVRANGGEIRILPITAGFSTSQFIERVIASAQDTDSTIETAHNDTATSTQVIEKMLAGANVLRQTAYQTSALVVQVAQRVSAVLAAGGKILLCGNGGSAADAQHIAAEYVGRYKRERRALPALALTTDTSILTAIGNDYGIEQIFARQIAALGQAGDILFALSTSGNSPNIIAAARVARELGLFVVGLTGMQPSLLQRECDLCLRVSSADTPRVQQTHIALLHVICELTDTAFEREQFNYA